MLRLTHFHGGPDSRLEARFLTKPARQAGIRLIGIDRPGMGRSRFQAGRRLLDWPDDVVEVAAPQMTAHNAMVMIASN